MKKIKLMFTLATSLALSGCGGSTGTTSPAQAQFLANQALGIITAMRLNQKPNVSSVPGANPGGNTVISFAPVTCITQSPVSATDVDGDGIPLTQTSTFDCTDQTTGTAGYSWGSKGTWKIEDTDDTKKWILGGYVASWNFASNYTYPTRNGTCGKVYPGGHLEYTGKGTFNQIANASAYIYNNSYSGTVVFTGGTYSGDYQYEGVWSGKVTPDSTGSNAWNTGLIEYSGQWSFSGNFPDEDGHGHYSQRTDGNILMTMKSKNLRYDNSCGSYYRSGEYTVDYGDGSTFKVVYACASADTKYYYNGIEYDPNAATATPTPACFN